LRSEAIELKWEPIASDVSQSGDLGYTYGSYELKHTAMNEVRPPEKGYYVRVWKRDAKGKWKLVFDTTSPIPDEKK
jgi:ketosteroid isomerase-like protein